jgi:hypothetical protein
MASLKEARTRGIASLTFVRFAFIGCDYTFWGNVKGASIRKIT